jgi:hypothetical protein
VKGYTKDDVQMHSEGFGRGARPAVNVKAYRFPTTDQVVERFGCSEETAGKALEYAFELACYSFWEVGATNIAEHYFGPAYGHVTHKDRKVWQEGRQGGWLVVHDLPDLDEWDGVMLNRWALFERSCRREVAYLTSWEQVEGSIEANGWALDQTAIEGAVGAALDSLEG